MLGVSGDRTRMNTCTLMLKRIKNRQRLPVVVNPTRTRTATVYLGKMGTPHPLARSLFCAYLGILNAGVLEILVCGTGRNIFCSCVCLRGSRRVVHVSSQASSTVTLTMHTSYPVFVCRSVLRERCVHLSSSSRPSARRRRRRAGSSSGIGSLRRTLRRTVGRRGCRLTTQLHSRVGEEGWVWVYACSVLPVCEEALGFQGGGRGVISIFCSSALRVGSP